MSILFILAGLAIFTIFAREKIKQFYTAIILFGSAVTFSGFGLLIALVAGVGLLTNTAVPVARFLLYFG